MFGRKKEDPEKVYDTLIGALDRNGLKYKADENEKILSIHMMGDDLPILTFIKVNDNHIRFTAILAFKATEESYREVAWNLNILNTKLTYGSFSLSPDDGIVHFDYSYIFANAKPTEGILMGLLSMVWTTVDEYDGDLKEIVPVSKDEQNPMFG